MATRILPEFKDMDTFKESIIIPERPERSYSSIFEKSKKKLKADGHYNCWICGSIENLQIHHYLCEWALGNVCNLERLKEVSEVFDVYGYGNAMKDTPIISVDDIRNLMVLCRLHHIQTYTGVHNLTFTTWLIQKIEKDNVDTVVDEDTPKMEGE
jgi:hypothetical protein